MKKSLSPYEALFPVPVVLVSCGDETEANIITIAWAGTICSKPPMLSISIRPARYSYEIIMKTKEFVVNIPTVEMLSKVDHCGIVSGRKEDKFKSCGFTKERSGLVAAPGIAECHVSIECRVKEIKELGVHTMFIAEIVTVNAEQEYLVNEKDIDYSRISPVVYVDGEYWSLDKKVGDYGFSAKNKTNDT